MTHYMLQNKNKQIYQDFFPGKKNANGKTKEATLKYCKKKNQLRILYPGKMSFKNKENLRLLRHINI